MTIDRNSLCFFFFVQRDATSADAAEQPARAVVDSNRSANEDERDLDRDDKLPPTVDPPAATPSAPVVVAEEPAADQPAEDEWSTRDRKGRTRRPNHHHHQQQQSRHNDNNADGDDNNSAVDNHIADAPIVGDANSGASKQKQQQPQQQQPQQPQQQQPSPPQTKKAQRLATTILPTPQVAQKSPRSTVVEKTAIPEKPDGKSGSDASFVTDAPKRERREVPVSPAHAAASQTASTPSAADERRRIASAANAVASPPVRTPVTHATQQQHATMDASSSTPSAADERRRIASTANAVASPSVRTPVAPATQQQHAAMAASSATPSADDRRRIASAVNAAASPAHTPTAAVPAAIEERRRKTPQHNSVAGPADYTALTHVVTGAEELATQRLVLHRLVDSAVDAFLHSDFAQQVRSQTMPRELQQEAWMLLTHRITKMAMKLPSDDKAAAAQGRRRAAE